MNVLEVIAPAKELAGAENVVLSGAQSLGKSGVGVHIASLSGEESSLVQVCRTREISAETIATSRKVDTKTMQRLGSLAASFDVVRVHGLKALLHVLLARIRIPVVAVVHGFTSHDAWSLASERLERRLLRSVTRVVAVSRALARDLRSSGVPESRIRVVENAIRFSADRAPLPADATGPTKLAFFGRLSPEKSPETLIAALAGCRQDVELDFYGDGPLRASLERRAIEAGLMDPVRQRVRFHGFVHDVQERMEAAHAVVLPSRNEGMPLVVLEAAALGRAVLASRVGGIPELAQAGLALRLIEPLRVSDWTQAFDQFAARRETESSDALARAPLVRRRFGQERWTLETLRILEESVSGRC